MDTTNRNNIPKQYKWRLEDIFETEKQWEQAVSDVQAMAKEFCDLKGKLGNNSDNFKKSLNLYSELSQKLELVYVYAKLHKDLDNGDTYYQSMYDRTMNHLFQIQEKISFFVPELTAIEPETLIKWINEDSSMKEYEHMIDDVIRSRPHILSTREEEIMAMACPSLEGFDSAFTMLDSVDLKRGEVIDENDQIVPLTDGMYSVFRESKCRRVRESAFSTLHNAFAGMGNTIASLYSGSVRANIFQARVRNYKSCLNMALFGDNLPESIYTSLIDAVHSALPSYHRYLNLRKKQLNVEELHIYDCYVPFVEMPKKEYTYEQSCEIVKDSLKTLGNQYIEDLSKLLAGGWVDVYETPNKATGAYAMGVYGVHPYMLLNFAGQLGDIFTLAHEAGHCMHSYYSDTQPYVLKEYPIFLAEIASTVNENIVMRNMMSHCDMNTAEGRQEKAFLLSRFVDEFIGTVIRQTMFAEFEMKVHQKAENGEPLTAETLCQLYHSLLTTYFGKDVVVDDYMNWEWARIPHFYSDFYVFKYATGFSAAAAISRQILSDGKTEDYLNFLHAGGSNYPCETLKKAGVDLTTPKPVQEALQEFSELIDELYQILA